MATMNFSVPDDLKDEFNEVFGGENKSAGIASLMRSAIDDRRRQAQRRRAVDALLDLRRRQAPASEEEVASARRALRK
jgi:hypothetical protein